MYYYYYLILLDAKNLASYQCLQPLLDFIACVSVKILAENLPFVCVCVKGCCVELLSPPTFRIAIIIGQNLQLYYLPDHEILN